MRQRVKNLEQVTASLKPYLEEYLQSNDINTSKNFKCINPKHDDSKPSMTCRQHPENAFCFSCGCTADIFTAAHFLEGKPIKGPGFVEDNVQYLAEKFNVKLNLEDLTPEEIYEHRTYQAYALAAELISDQSFGDYSAVKKEIKRREWDLEKCAEWGIGTVNYNEYKGRLKAAGFDVAFLSGIDLDRSNLFDNHNLLFTVYDDRGRPVGFSAKNLNHNGDKDSGPKYINTRVTGLECAIFKKGERLYGFDIAKEAPSPLYIFEGQADVITARHSGLMNCCCTLGTAFSMHHIDLLKKHGIFNIIFVFDGDKAGELALQKALDTKLAKERDFRVKLAQLPAGTDPDELIREKGIAKFNMLKKWTAFEWRINQFVVEAGEEIDDEKCREIAEKMTPIIVAESSHIRQEEMARQVAKMTGYNLTTILSEVKRLRNEKEAQIQDKKNAVVEALMRDMRYSDVEVEDVLNEALIAVHDIDKEHEVSAGGNKTIEIFQSQKEVDDKKSGEFAGFYMKPDGLGGVGARLDDDWKSGHMILVGGGAQAGKTSFVSQMAYEIADDKRNNAICIYHSIDDAARFIMYKWLCNATGELQAELNHMSNPNYWIAQEMPYDLREVRDKAYKKIINMAKDNRLILRDATNGPALASAENVLRFQRENNPDKNIVLFIDNFYKLPDFQEIPIRERVTKLSQKIKMMTTLYRCTIISTVEYRKLLPGAKPTNADIAESRSLEYDSTGIVHLHNDLHHKSEEEALLIHTGDNGKIMPRIWCKFGKNKISGYEGRDFLDLYPSNAQYRAVDLDTAIQEQKDRKEFLRNGGNDDSSSQ